MAHISDKGFSVKLMVFPYGERISVDMVIVHHAGRWLWRESISLLGSKHVVDS